MKISSINMVNFNNPAFMKKNPSKNQNPVYTMPQTREEVVEDLIRRGSSRKQAEDAVNHFPCDGDALYDTPPTQWPSQYSATEEHYRPRLDHYDIFKHGVVVNP